MKKRSKSSAEYVMAFSIRWMKIYATWFTTLGKLPIYIFLWNNYYIWICIYDEKLFSNDARGMDGGVLDSGLTDKEESSKLINKR